MQSLSRRRNTKSTSTEWWRTAVVYQIYPKSFADADGDGFGDLAGIESHLDYLVQLGVDAIWLSPIFTSPQVDAGYDVADYREIDPLYGKLDDFKRLIASSHTRGLKVLIDIVPNHTSSAHPWFAAAIGAGAESVERERYIFRAGRSSSQPPNNWTSVFGGSAWELVGDNGLQEEWYLHLFDKEMPDLNWRNPDVRREFLSILAFWCQLGVDGFRIDTAHGLVKAEALPDVVHAMNESMDLEKYPMPMWDQPEVHDIYRSWRKLVDRYGAILVAEAWVDPPSRFAKYVRPDEMHQGFNLAYLMQPWDAQRLSRVIHASLSSNAAVGAPTTWVLGSHDVVRQATRFGYEWSDNMPSGLGPDDHAPDAALGLRRARASALLMLALPGAAYLFQGEELGLPEVRDIPDSSRQDPTFLNSGGTKKGRDGCRVPIPWLRNSPAFGFNATGKTWLPQPAEWGDFAVDAEEPDPESTLNLYRAALAIRRESLMASGSVVWVESAIASKSEGVLAFRNGGVLVVCNTSAEPAFLSREYEQMLASDCDSGARSIIAPDTTVWMAWEE